MTDEKIRAELRAARAGDPTSFQRAFERRLRERTKRAREAYYYHVIVTSAEPAPRTIDHGTWVGTGRQHPGRETYSWSRTFGVCHISLYDVSQDSWDTVPGVSTAFATPDVGCGLYPVEGRSYVPGTFWRILVGVRQKQGFNGEWLNEFERMVMHVPALEIPPECVAYFQELHARARPCSLCQHPIGNHSHTGGSVVCGDCDAPCSGELF